MTAGINDCVDKLKIILDTALVTGGLANKGYDYRTAPDKYKRSYLIHYFSGLPVPGTAAGPSAYYDVTIVLMAQHDKTEAGLRSAERDLNDMENAVINALVASRRTTEWHKFTFVYPTWRPRSDVDMPETRISQIPTRILLR